MPDDISIKDYIDLRISNVEVMLRSQAEFNAQHFQLNELAIKKAEDSMTGRLESMNQFREQIKEERGNLATKEHLAVMKEAIDKDLVAVGKRIDPLEKANAFSAGKMWMVMAIFAAVPTVIAIIAFIK